MLSAHGTGTSTCVFVGGRRRVHTTFPDHAEMVEEFEPTTLELVVRRWKARKSPFGKEPPWEYEIGEAPTDNASNRAELSIGSVNPIFVNRDNFETWEFRIRNLPYSKDVYDLSIDHEKQDIVLRTSNKKYFKRFKIPTLYRLGMPLEASALSMSHANTTLVIEYEKPDKIIQMEQTRRQDMQRSDYLATQKH